MNFIHIAPPRNFASKNKKILTLNRIITFLGVVIYVLIVFAAIFIEIPMVIRNIIIALALVMLLLFGIFNLNILQKTGYYECQECKHQYIPSFAFLISFLIDISSFSK